MNEDPAITEAKRLIAAKQSKTAVLLLFQRIEYLDHELARLTAPPPPSRARRGNWGWTLFLIVFLLVVVIGGITFAVALNNASDKRVEEATERLNASIDLDRVCAYAASENTSVDCEQWTSDAMEQQEDAVIECSKVSDDDVNKMKSCLQDHGILLPR